MAVQSEDTTVNMTSVFTSLSLSFSKKGQSKEVITIIMFQLKIKHTHVKIVKC